MRLSPVLLTLLLLTSCVGSKKPFSSPEPFLFEMIVDTPQSTTPTPQASVNIPVIGYFSDYRVLNPDWAKWLTDFVYFSAEPRTDGSLDTSRLTEDNWRRLHGVHAKVVR